MMDEKRYGSIGTAVEKSFPRRKPGREEALEEKRERMIAKLEKEIRDEKGRETPSKELLDDLWETIGLFSGEWFETAKHLKYRYFIHGNEIFVNRKDKSITRATVNLAFKRTLALLEKGCAIPGPKTIGGFGASYLYPVFLALKIIPEGQMSTKRRGRPRLDTAEARVAPREKRSCKREGAGFIIGLKGSLYEGCGRTEVLIDAERQKG